MEYKYPPLPMPHEWARQTIWGGSLKAFTKEQLQQYAEQAVAPLLAEIERLRRGEFICGKCGLRKNSEHTHEADF